MTITLPISLAMIAAAYLVGSIPFGVLLARAKGIDLRAIGSGNIGATNVGRALGRKLGLACLALDILKGVAPTLATGALLTHRWTEPVASAALMGLWVTVGLAAILGHVFPIWLGFRGGKGVATSIGVGLGLFPYFTLPMAAAVVCYFTLRLTTGYVSLGSIALAVTFPAWFALFAWWRAWPIATHWPLLAVAITLGLLLILRHRDNITRLLRGREHAIANTPPDPK